MNLSVCIITLNEETRLEKCLRSVVSIADEIIVVDSGSSDNTVAIAKKFGAKVFFRKFDNYADQKNFALEKSAGEWVFSIDGDEEIEDRLAEEIKNAVKDSKFDAYSIPRKNIIFGKFIRYTRWQPELDRHIWLFKKDKSRWVGDVHEEIVTNGKVGKLRYAKIHHQYETISEFMAMMNAYSTLDAREKINKGVRFSIGKMIFLPIYNFLIRYFYRLGFLDGLYGFTLSLLMAIYHIEVWIKIWEYRLNK